jgi:hypothetical protein
MEENIDDVIQTYNSIIYEMNKYISNVKRRYCQKRLAGRLLAIMGVIYEKGFFGVGPDLFMAYKKYELSAQLNCPFGTFRLAQCHEKGIGTVKNIEQALYFYRCSAKLGSIEALHTFGTILIQNDFDGEFSEEVGVVYLRLAANKATKTYPFSCYDYSRYIEHSMKKDFFDVGYCFKSYLKGAILECPNCQFRVGQLYETGEMGVEISLANSVKWYQKASSNGHSDAQLKIANYILRKNDPQKDDFVLAFNYALKSAISDNPRGAKYVSIMYQKGIGTKKNESLSKWWEKVYEVFCSSQKISKESLSFSIFENISKKKPVSEEIPMRRIYTTSTLKAV